MSDFDDREDDHDDDDIEYTIKVRFIIFNLLFIYFQKIIGKRKNGRTYEYQVVWSGCDEDTATWEPEDNLQNAKSMISNFERGKPLKIPSINLGIMYARTKLGFTTTLMRRTFYADHIPL